MSPRIPALVFSVVLAATGLGFLSCGGGGGAGTPAPLPGQDGSAAPPSGTGDLGGTPGTGAGEAPDTGGGTPLAGGGGDGPSGSPGSGADTGTGFFEPEPDATELAATAAGLLAGIEAGLDPALRAQVEAAVRARAPAGRSAADYPASSLAEAWVGAAVDAFFAGDQDTALWCALEGYGSGPDDPYVLSQLGFFLLYRGRIDEARDFLLRAYGLDPDYAPTLFGLGFAYEQAGDFGRATYYYRRLVALHPENPYFGYPLARAYAAAGELQAARAALEPVAPALSGIPEVQDLLEDLPPAPEGSTDPYAPPPVPSGLGNALGLSSVAAGFARCAEEYITSTHVLDAAEAAAALDAADQDTQAAFQDSSWAAGQCTADCWARWGSDPMVDACDAGCYAEQCARDLETARVGADTYVDRYTQWVAHYMVAVGNSQACLMGVYYRYRHLLSPTARADVLSQIWNLLTEADAGRLDVWRNDVLVTVAAYENDAATSCGDAQQAVEDIDPYDLLYGQSGDQGELCGVGACIRWNGTQVTFDGGVGPYSLHLSGSYFTGFTGTFGRKVWSRGPATVSLFVRFDTRSNTSTLEIQGTVTGPITGLKAEQRVALTPR